VEGAGLAGHTLDNHLRVLVDPAADERTGEHLCASVKWESGVNMCSARSRLDTNEQLQVDGGAVNFFNFFFLQPSGRAR
jgi:hypothetical protein